MAQMSLFDTVQDNDIVEEIKNLDMSHLTPMEAMNILYNPEQDTEPLVKFS